MSWQTDSSPAQRYWVINGVIKMSNSEISQAILNAHNIDQVVSLINDANNDKATSYFGGTELRDGDTLAGHYAYDAAEDFDSENLNPENFDGHLDYLIEMGAEFDREKALQAAIKLNHTNG